MEPGEPTGAFGKQTYDKVLIGGSTYIGDILTFDASSYDDTYSGQSVQSSAIQVLACIKI